MTFLVSFFKWFCIACLVMIAIIIIVYSIEAYLRIRAWMKARTQVASAETPANDGYSMTASSIEPVVLVTELENLRFSDYIKCVCDLNYSVLVISGIPGADEIFMAWVRLLSQFYTLIDNEEAARHIELVSTIEAINTKILQVSGLVEVLRSAQNDKSIDQLVNCLQLWGYEFDFSTDSLQKDLDTVERWLSSDRLKLEKAKLKYQEIEDERVENGQKEVQKSDYIRNLLAIAKHRDRTTIRPEDINTMEYCIMYKELADYNEQVFKAHSKK